MFKNYLTSAWRNLIKNRKLSIINIFGLAIGLAACILITLFVRDELGYDSFWEKSDRIFRTETTFRIPGRDPITAASTPGPVMEAMIKDFPDIERAARLALQGPVVTIGDESYIDSLAVVDPDIVNIFDLKVIQGDLEAALADVSSIALGQELREKYFGQEEAMGQTLTLSMFGITRDYKVAAIYEDLPLNTQVALPAMIAIDPAPWQENAPFVFHSWFSINAQLYFTVREGVSIEAINSGMEDFVNNNFPPMPIGDPDTKKSDLIQIANMNVKDLHLFGGGMGEYRPTGSMDVVETFTAIAVLILVIAAINFMNLSTAHATQRAREVSLRKVLGASRGNLVVQFIGEALMVTLFGLMVAMVLVEFILPGFNEFSGKSLQIDYGSFDLAIIVGMAFLAGILGAIYPAFVLSAFRPSSVLKANKSVNTKASGRLRSALVVFQFAVSIGLFVSTAVVYGQMQYAASKDLGFSKDNMLVVSRVGRLGSTEKQELLLDELRRHPQVVAAAASGEVPGFSNENNTSMRTPDMSVDATVLIGQRRVGYDFFKTYQIDVLAGRTYQEDRADTRPTTQEIRDGSTATGTVVMNESALGRLGLGTPEEALGKSVIIGVGNPGENLELTLIVIGVVPDIHFDSLRSTIRPEVYILGPGNGNFITARFQGDPDTLVDFTETLWRDNVEGVPFNHSFVGENLDNLYQSERNEAIMFAGFSGLAILVACLGLFGLASFAAERRTKEIGVRKVMGASVTNIVRMMVWQFSLPVLVANLIAWPVAFWQMSKWLERFVYRIDGTAIIVFCVVGSLAALLIAWATVAGNSIRVARANPIQALRYE